MGIENMDFGRAHHSGMPTAEELRWRRDIVKAELEGRYGEETIKQESTMPLTGTIDNFNRPSVVNKVPDANYLRITARAEQAWNRRME